MNNYDSQGIKKALDLYPDNWNVTLYDGSDINFIADNHKNIILSECAPIGLCNRCQNPVFVSPVRGYVATCFTCNEDLYEIEFTRC